MPSALPAATARSLTVVLAAALATVLGLTLLPSGVPTAGAAGIPTLAAAVRSAEQGAEQARAATAADSERLAAGTARWEAGTRALARVQARAADAATEADQARSETAGQREALDDFAAAAYRNPMNPELQVVLTADGEDVPSALAALSQLSRVGASAGSTLDALRAAELRSREAEAEQARLLDVAREQQEALATEVAGLKATAARTAAVLGAAEETLAAAKAELATAQAAQAAAVAAGAARSRALREAASRSASPSGASCSGASTRGYANGTIPDEALCPLDHAPGHRLRADAAAAFNRMTAQALAQRGTPLCVTDSYRSYSEQVDVYSRKPHLAAVPGRSNHGYGVATDLGCGAESFSSDTYRWLKANAGSFGWVHPSWAEPGGSKPEPWHWEFTG